MPNERNDIKKYINSKLLRLQNSKNDSETKAMLAKLRRGIGKAPGSSPELWEITLEGMPTLLEGKGDDPSYAEWAVHIALTLFALHQQGKDFKSEWMNKSENSLGKAVSMLISARGDSADDNRDRIERRFTIAATASDIGELTHHLRGIVQLLKVKGIPLDYAMLAYDLYLFQFPGAKDSVRLRWGRDFYKFKEPEKKTEDA